MCQHIFIHPALHLSQGSHGRGVFTDADITTGELLMLIPLDACLVHAEETHEVGDGSAPLPSQWNLWLALQYIQAIREDRFWEAYHDEFLAAVDVAELPLAFSEEQLDALPPGPHREQLLKQRKQFAAAWQQQGGGSLPPVLIDANALVLSRCYDLGVTGRQSVSGFVPFLDLLNHSQLPNVEVRIADKADIQALQQGQPAEAAVAITAKQHMKAGTEVLSCYAPADAPDALMYLKYGFVEHKRFGSTVTDYL